MANAMLRDRTRIPKRDRILIIKANPMVKYQQKLIASLLARLGFEPQAGLFAGGCVRKCNRTGS